MTPARVYPGSSVALALLVLRVFAVAARAAIWKRRLLSSTVVVGHTRRKISSLPTTRPRRSRSRTRRSNARPPMQIGLPSNRTSRFRKALGEGRRYIKTIPGRGYIFVAESNAEEALPSPDGPASGGADVHERTTLRDALHALVHALRASRGGDQSGIATARLTRWQSRCDDERRHPNRTHIASILGKVTLATPATGRAEPRMVEPRARGKHQDMRRLLLAWILIFMAVPASAQTLTFSTGLPFYKHTA